MSYHVLLLLAHMLAKRRDREELCGHKLTLQLSFRPSKLRSVTVRTLRTPSTSRPSLLASRSSCAHTSTFSRRILAHLTALSGAVAREHRPVRIVAGTSASA